MKKQNKIKIPRRPGSFAGWTRPESNKTENQKKRLYCLAKRSGLRLQLCRKGDVTDPDYQTFRILDRETSAVVHSGFESGYGLTLDQVENYIACHLMRLERPKIESVGPAAPMAAAVEPAKGVPEPGLDANSALEIAPNNASGGQFLTIGDAQIPIFVAAVFKLIGCLNLGKDDPERSPEGRKVIGMYRAAWETACKCSYEDLRLYLFARLLRTAKLM